MAVRQWVISVPKRLRWFLAERPEAVSALTKIFMSEVKRLVQSAAGVEIRQSDNEKGTDSPRIGGISFLHRFGSALTERVRRRLVRWFKRRGFLDAQAVRCDNS